MSLLNIDKIDDAHEKLSKYITKTPLVTNETINSLVDAKVYFKLENLQYTGSFKIRGATYKISLLSDDERKKGIVAYSSGNHGQAVACASFIQNIKATIVMPDNAPKIKINKTKSFGANIFFYNSKSEDRQIIAKDISIKKALTLVPPYDDIDIITGQGTVGKEISEQLNSKNIIPEIYLCCVGGGGLISGSSYYLKKNFPNLECYSVEPEDFNDTLLSLKKNSIVTNKKTSESICDSLVVARPGKITFKINQSILKKGLVVSDGEVKKTIKTLYENLKVVVEPGGAVAAAALLSKKIEVKNKTVVAVLSGGNIDSEFFSKIISS